MKRFDVLLSEFTLIALLVSGCRPTPSLATETPTIPTTAPSSTPTPEQTNTPTPTLTATDIPQSRNLCMNYGQGAIVFDQSQEDKDIQLLQTAQISCVRIAYDGWNKPKIESIALEAKKQGMRVIIGGDWGKLSPEQLTDYHSRVLEQAAWAQENHIDQFSLGNEQEYRLAGGLTQEKWSDFLSTLATDVRKVYSGKISYEISGDHAKLWTNQKELGDIDLLGVNLYGGYEFNRDAAEELISVFGKDHIYISETNADMRTGDYDQDSVHASTVANDTLKLLDLDVPVYYFAFDTCNQNNGVPDNFGLLQCNQMAQPLTAAELGIK